MNKKTTITLANGEKVELSKESYEALSNKIKKKQEYFAIYDDATKTTQEIFEECKSKFKCQQYKKFTDEEFPKPKLPTLRYFKKNIESDEENKNKSADYLEKEGHKGITLRERLLMELQYFNETGGHLDIYKITLCSGSRDYSGEVPYASWFFGKFTVSCYGVFNSKYDICSRSVINLDPYDL